MLRPTAVSVTPLSDFNLELRFDNGEIRRFDVTPYIKGAWFGELRDESVFRSVFVNGETVEWQDGQDICPDDLYYKSKLIRTE